MNKRKIKSTCTILHPHFFYLVNFLHTTDYKWMSLTMKMKWEESLVASFYIRILIYLCLSFNLYTNNVFDGGDLATNTMNKNLLRLDVSQIKLFWKLGRSWNVSIQDSLEHGMLEERLLKFCFQVLRHINQKIDIFFYLNQSHLTLNFEFIKLEHFLISTL